MLLPVPFHILIERILAWVVSAFSNDGRILARQNFLEGRFVE